MRITIAFAIPALLFTMMQPARADDRSAYLAALQPMLALKSYRAVLVQSQGGVPFVDRIEFVAPDRVRSTNNAAAMVAIGTKTWVRAAGDAAWSAGPVGDPKTLNPMSLLLDAASASNFAYTDAGAGTWDGKPAHLSTITTTTNGTTSTATLYIGADMLVHHVESKQAGGGTFSLDFRDFNAPDITIEPPVGGA